jgi:hypothetical protein
MAGYAEERQEEELMRELLTQKSQKTTAIAQMQEQAS